MNQISSLLESCVKLLDWQLITILWAGIIFQITARSLRINFIMLSSSLGVRQYACSGWFRFWTHFLRNSVVCLRFLMMLCQSYVLDIIWFLVPVILVILPNELWKVKFIWRNISICYYTVTFLYLSYCVKQVLKYLEGARNPLPSSMHDFYVLIETTGSDESHDK